MSAKPVPRSPSPVAARLAIGAFFFAALISPVLAGHYSNAYSPGNTPWPGGTIPYEFDIALSASQKQTYLDGLRDYEVGADIQFIPRTTEPEWVRFKYNPAGPNLVSGNNPVVVEINQLTRSQILHEMGHALGLLHEHQRSDRGDFVTTCSTNIDPAFAGQFTIDPAGVNHGPYDFRSIMHYGRNVGSIPPHFPDTIKAEPEYERWQELMGTLLLSPGDIATLSFLYGPPSTSLSSVVTTTADGGPGSLRAAMYYAEANPGTTITFNIPQSDPGFANGVFTIQPTGHLPEMITNGTVIDGTSQPGYAGKPLVFLDGSQLIPETGQIPCILFLGANCSVKGLAVRDYPWCGFVLRYAEAVGNSIIGCWSGLDHTGTANAPNAFQGVFITDGASNNTIGGASAGAQNVFSGNTQYGVWISGSATTGNVVRRSYIGTDCLGTTVAVPNNLGGVIITGNASGNTIGPGNVISGNGGAGILVTGMGVQNNTVRENIIGLDAAGNAGMPNDFAGVSISSGATGNTVGGEEPACGNLISGNLYGVVIVDPGTNGNFVEGNTIGLSVDGSTLGNSLAGIGLWEGAQKNTIGGTVPGAGNIIAGNGGYGIALFDPNQISTIENTFLGNLIYDNSFAGISIGMGNNSQAAPALTTATLGASGTNIIGALTSTANTNFRIEFFASDPAPGFGEGRRYLGSVNATTDDDDGFSGDVGINTTFKTIALAGQVITATATVVTTGDTSAFSNAVTVTSTDTDSDGMPDDYEMANGLDKTVNDAALDKDGDGANNFGEFLAGTDPQDRSDILKAISIERTESSTTLRFATEPGMVYRIEKSIRLAAGVWHTMVTSLMANAAETTVIDQKTAGAARCFYRAVVLP